MVNSSKWSKGAKRSFCSHLYPRGITHNPNSLITPDPNGEVHGPTVAEVTKLHLAKSANGNDQRDTEIANTLCVICYSRLKDFDSPVSTEIEVAPCNHHFHKHCLTKWKAMSKICPICRQTTFL